MEQIYSRDDDNDVEVSRSRLAASVKVVKRADLRVCKPYYDGEMCIFVGFAGMAELVLKEWTYDVFVYVVTYNAIATQKVFGCRQVRV